MNLLELFVGYKCLLLALSWRLNLLAFIQTYLNDLIFFYLCQMKKALIYIEKTSRYYDDSRKMKVI